uniref:Uncharacterized protein n=1 Tax=Anopheles atroparvus TaxID=41427 RepID=A0AAG5DRP1_ANOAO
MPLPVHDKESISSKVCTVQKVCAGFDWLRLALELRFITNCCIISVRASTFLCRSSIFVCEMSCWTFMCPTIRRNKRSSLTVSGGTGSCVLLFSSSGECIYNLFNYDCKIVTIL